MNNIKLRLVDTGNMFGTMNSGTIRLSNMKEEDIDKIVRMRTSNGEILDLDDPKLTPSERSIIFKDHRIAAGNALGFDYNKMFMADQVKKDGSYFEITSDYVEANPNGWTDIPEDILVVTDKVPGVVIGHPVADCPVVMMSDEKNGVAAIGHCSAEMIDKKLPKMIAECLVNNYDSKIEDIRVFVGACAGNNWTYDSWPKWAQDLEFWKKAIIEKNGEFKIDLEKALSLQFKDSGLSDDNISFSGIDTLTSDAHYSNAMSRSNPLKHGRQFEGLFFEEVKEEDITVK